MIVTIADFKGKFAVSNGTYIDDNLTEYITRYERIYLLKLLGANMYNQFISDLSNGVPRSPLFLSIYNEFATQVCGQILISQGIKDMLVSAIYFEWQRDLINLQTPNGGVIPKSETSDVASTLYSTMWQKYNEGIRTFRAIRQYIIANSNAVGGQVLLTSIVDGGTGYSDAMDVPCLGGSGTGLKIDLTTVDGVITEIAIKDAGTSYKVGDTVSIEGGNADASLIISYVGLDYVEFEGINLEFAYWL